MSNGSIALRFNTFARSNGHPAWLFSAKNVEDAATEDLLWRTMQTTPRFTERVAKAAWPDAQREGGKLLLHAGMFVSLAHESCGSYSCSRNSSRLEPLRGDERDMRYINDAIRRPQAQGYYLGPLLQREKGWQHHTVVANVLRLMKMRMTPTDRYYFNEKACHRHVLMSPKVINEAEKACKQFYPVIYGFNRWKVYWYSAENGEIVFGVVHFYNDAQEVITLPVSAWMSDSAKGYANNIVYDALHPPAPHPMYNLDKLTQDTTRYALICNNEHTVEHIKKCHAWIWDTYKMCPTTYSSMRDTDWGALKSVTPIIFPGNSVYGCIEAFDLYSALRKHGLTPYFCKRQNGGNSKVSLNEDIMQMNNIDGECVLHEFAEHCAHEFGVKPPQGILPQAVSLLSLPEGTSKPEPLLKDLLDYGELLMLYAWRGVGKSFFALLLALCFANAKTAFGGRVCPSRKYRTLLIDAEMSPGSLKKRALALCHSLGLPESAVDELKVRSVRHEKKDLNLDTETGWKNLEPDMMESEIIFVDSLFKFFSSAMTSEFSGTAALQKCFDWCRKHNKTLIIIDHEGKKGGTSFGSMGKEIGLDVVIQLTKIKGVTHARPTKVRNHAPASDSWLKYQTNCASDGRLSLEEADTLPREHESTTVLPPGGYEGDGNSPKNTPDGALDKNIIAYIEEHPEQAQGVIVDALQAQGLGGRSKLQARIKELREAGKLPFWEKASRKGLLEITETLEGEE